MSEPITFEPIGEARAFISKLNEHQSKTSAPSIGERLAFVILEKTPAELREIASKLNDDDEAGHTLLDKLMAAHDSLEQRLDFVIAAL